MCAPPQPTSRFTVVSVSLGSTLRICTTSEQNPPATCWATPRSTGDCSPTRSGSENRHTACASVSEVRAAIDVDGRTRHEGRALAEQERDQLTRLCGAAPAAKGHAHVPVRIACQVCVD